jgi:hypothetical protein
MPFKKIIVKIKTIGDKSIPPKSGRNRLILLKIGSKSLNKKL